ncbi:DUF262 domain-containing protein [Hymenobacter pini]|uniref:DUF262 domain-containing protein n=1 Tax=Hymenobacter pini TaxID=2880879 RepID=UPI001CF447DC|nr:DUF262 domain-containing protein [Hymenobacter pini]MCA8830309.1 DUF262 domain-containing protein [Hymenobacter pini]
MAKTKKDQVAVKKNTTTSHLADILFPIRKEDVDVNDIPLEERKVHTETYDFSIHTIHRYLLDESMVVPNFQREYVWSRNQASRLIESLIIQCPIPVIYLSQTSDEQLLVIDGNQRLSSIKLFLEDEFALSGLTTYPDLEGFKFSELDPRFQRHITNRTLRCITLLKETHPQIKFDVFERLNTGAIQLLPQELRHGIYYGPLIQLTSRLAENELFQHLTKTKDNKRMKGDELVLRFIAFYKEYEIYKLPLIGFINRFTEENRNIDNIQQKTLSNIFEKSLKILNTFFGDKTFKILGDKTKSPSFNTALFDAEMISIARINPNMSLVNQVDKAELTRDVIELMNDENFYRFIKASTSNEAAIKYRITAMENIFRKHLKMQ